MYCSLSAVPDVTYLTPNFQRTWAVMDLLRPKL